MVCLLAGHDVAPGEERHHRPLLELEAHRPVGAPVAEPGQLAGFDEVDLVAAVEADDVALDRWPGHRGPVVVVLDVEGRDVVHPPEDDRPALGQPEGRHVPGVEEGADPGWIERVTR